MSVAGNEPDARRVGNDLGAAVVGALDAFMAWLLAALVLAIAMNLGGIAERR